MIGPLLAIVILFAILFVVTRSVAFYRGELSVVGAENAESDARRSAAIGVGSGVIVVVLVALLFTGVTRWEWFGHPAPKAAPIAAPAKSSPPPVLTTAAPTPSLGAGAQTPSPSPPP